MFLTLIVFILILSFLIIIHELGHFTAAKKFGLYVHEFGLGLPPKIWGKKHGETEYTVNALPIGGFVKIEGEDREVTSKIPKSRNFQYQKPKVKLVVLLAGVFMNFIFAICLYYFFFIFNQFLSNPLIAFTDYNFIGAREIEINTLVSGVTKEELEGTLISGDIIVGVTEDSSGNTLGVKSLESFANLNKAQKEEYASSISLKQFQDFVASINGETNLVIYNIQDQTVRQEQTQVTFNPEIGKNVIGIYLGKLVVLDYGVNAFTKVSSGFTHSVNMIGYSLKSFGALIGISFESRDLSVVSSGVSGPVGIYSVVKSVVVSGSPQTFWIIVDLTALISLSLAFMNLLPIPALDGGRVVFVAFEGLTGKKLSAEVEGNIHKFGMIFLLTLLALVTLKDIINLF